MSEQEHNPRQTFSERSTSWLHSYTIVQKTKWAGSGQRFPRNERGLKETRLLTFLIRTGRREGNNKVFRFRRRRKKDYYEIFLTINGQPISDSSCTRCCECSPLTSILATPHPNTLIRLNRRRWHGLIETCPIHKESDPWRVLVIIARWMTCDNEKIDRQIESMDKVER